MRVQRPGPGVQEEQGGVPAPAPVPVVGLHVVVDRRAPAHPQGSGLLDRVEGRGPALGRGAGRVDPDRERRAGRLRADVGGDQRPAHAGHRVDPARRQVRGRAAGLHAADIDRHGRERPVPRLHRGQRGSRAAVEAVQGLAEARSARVGVPPDPAVLAAVMCAVPVAGGPVLSGPVLSCPVLSCVVPAVAGGPVLSGVVPAAGLVPARLVPARLVPARLVPARLVPARLVPAGLAVAPAVVRTGLMVPGRVRDPHRRRGAQGRGGLPGSGAQAAAERVITWPWPRPAAARPAPGGRPRAAGCAGWTARRGRPRCRSR